MIPYWFKTKERVSDFAINCFRNCKESDGRVTTRQDFRKFFFILKIFKLLEIQK